MKTSLYLTDVVVSRHERDPVNFLGSCKTRKVLEVKNSTDFVESLLNLYSWKALNSDGDRVSNSTGWSRLLQLSLSRRKDHLVRYLRGTQHILSSS